MPEVNFELGEIHSPTTLGYDFSCDVDYRYLRADSRYSETSFRTNRTLEETNTEFFSRMIQDALGREPSTVQVRVYPDGRGMGTNYLSLCTICHKWTSYQETLITVYTEDSVYHEYRSRKETICRQCVRRADFTPPLQECSICGGYQQQEERVNPYYGGWDEEGEFCCSSCGETHIRCDRCERWTNQDYLHDGYCENCREGDEEEEYHSEPRPSSSIVHDYGFKPPPLFHHFNNIQHKGQQTSTEGKRIYLGVELEIDKVHELPELAKELFDMSQEGQLFYLKWDGSLEHGFEIVSQPCTLKYHRAEFPWKEIIKKCKEHNAEADNTHSCGFHIHFNVTCLSYENQEGESVVEHQEFNELKLIFIIEKFWYNFEKFARRAECSYAPKNSHQIADKIVNGQKEIRKIKTIKDMKQGAGGRMAVNLHTRNQSTIELRMFKGTLNYEILIATLEMVDYIIHFIRDKGVTYIYKLTWDEFVRQIPAKRYAYLVNYLMETKLEAKQCKVKM